MKFSTNARRRALKQGLAAAAALGSAGLLAPPAHAFQKAAFEAKTVPEALKALGVTTLASSREVSVQGPEIAENGAVVPVTVGTSLPGIRQLAVLAEKNPAVLVALFQLNPALEPSFSLRIKMAESSDVWAVAVASDGKAWVAKRDIRVTLGGCG